MAVIDPRHGSRVTIHENRGGWCWWGLQGVCIAISARDEFMLLEVEFDPEGFWPRGRRVLVELGTSELGTTTAHFAELLLTAVHDTKYLFSIMNRR